MRAKQIFEFTRNTDPLDALDIGPNSTSAKTKIINSLLERGLKFNFDWGTESDQNTNYKQLVNHAYQLQTAITKLEKLGLDITTFRIFYFDQLEVPMHRVLDSNHVLFSCLTKEIANYTVELLKKLAVQRNGYKSNLSYEDEAIMSYFYYLADGQDTLLDNLLTLKF